MGRVRCQSTSQSGEWWAVVIPGEKEGKIMDKWEGPADLVLRPLTTRIHYTFLRPLSCPFTIFPHSLESLPQQPGVPGDPRASPPPPWMPYLLPLEALGDPHSPIFLKLEGDDLSSMTKPRSP